MTPKPLPDEALGSWLGRAAARYRIGVDELIAASGLEVDIGEQACTWLAAVPKGEGAIRRLCHISRLAQVDVLRMLTPKRLYADVFPCCYRCLVLNPWEIESPYWPLRWMTGESSLCDHAEIEVENATLGMLSRARNMRRLVKELEHKRRSRMADKSRRKGQFGVASMVR